MSTSIFYDPPVLARRVYAGEVRVVNDIKFWDKITKVVYSRIHSDDNNLNFEVVDPTKEITFQTNQISFKDVDGDELGYIDATGVIHGLTIDGHTNDGDFDTLEDRVDDLESNVSILHTNVATHTANIFTLTSNIETISSNISILYGNVETIESNISILHGNVDTIESITYRYFTEISKRFRVIFRYFTGMLKQ